MGEPYSKFDSFPNDTKMKERNGLMLCLTIEQYYFEKGNTGKRLSL